MLPETKADATQADEFGGETLEPGTSQRGNLAVALGEGWLKLGAVVWPHFLRNSLSSALHQPSQRGIWVFRNLVQVFSRLTWGLCVNEFL